MSHTLICFSLSWIHSKNKFQNAILQRHAEEVSGATSKLRAETAAAAERTAALLTHRRALVAALVQALQAVAIPGRKKIIYI